MAQHEPCKMSSRKWLEGASLEGSVLKVEVIHLSGLRNPEYRLGDFAKRTLGGEKLRPYIEVECESAKVRTGELGAHDAMVDDEQALETVLLPLPRKSSENCLRDLLIKFQVFDARQVQSFLRGDPLIGRASLSLGEESLGTPNVRTILLTRNGKASSRTGQPQSHGAITLRIGVLAPCLAYDVLAAAPNRPLAQVVKALSQVLTQSLGVDAFLDACPDVLREPDNEEEDLLQQMLQTWVVQLSCSTRRLNGRELDAVTVWHLAKVMRTLHNIVCARAPLEISETAEQLTTDWLRNFLDQCAEGAPGTLDERRLQQLAETGSMSCEVLHQRLSEFDVKLPQGVSESVALSILIRLIEAEHTGEVDIFSSEALIENGKAARGLAAVIRPGDDLDDGVRAFLYDYRGIDRWQQEHGTDPTTREVLDRREILPLTLRWPWLYTFNSCLSEAASTARYRSIQAVRRACQSRAVRSR
mmetsp:Transcript_21702/g.41556  ORF Transcript_21702/g.41556 Transcript_21702/m.41556 type:complete len:472 (-) Transcript_21702:31-1446(-)